MNVVEESKPGVDPAWIDDVELLRAHVDGDPQAFGLLVARHQDRLWAVALRTMQNPDEAADALQDALISAFRRASSFRGDAKVTTWMHRIVVNACLDHLRYRKVRRTEPLPEEQDRLESLGEVPQQDPVLAGELHNDVVAALATLGPDQRAAVILVDMEGYSVAEAAALLGCAPGTVKSRCSRGRARLLPLLAGHRLTAAPPEEPRPSATTTEAEGTKTPTGTSENGTTAPMLSRPSPTDDPVRPQVRTDR